MRLADLVAASHDVSRTPGRLEKIARVAALLRVCDPVDVALAIPFLSGALTQGKIGVGYAAIRESSGVPPAAASTLTLTDVDRAFDEAAGVRGAGSAALRSQRLRDLFGRATSDEQDFLRRLLFGELRQGALEGVLLDAVASAASIPAEQIRRAFMLAGSLTPVAVAALGEGEPALRAMDVHLFSPLQPMLAGSAGSVDEALDEFDEAGLEFKLDGARIQVHKSGTEVRVYSRSLRNVSAAVGDVIEAVRALPARELILDGEAIALRPNGTPHPFQITMRRFGRKRDVDAMRGELPLSPFFFDCLYIDGASTLDEPLSRRVALLDEAVPEAMRTPTLLRPARESAAAFLARAESMGHEGVMVKSLEASYAAGRRGSAWLKVKRAHTLDLVILAAEWGSGRRRGTLSNLHLGARDQERGGFVMLGKTFKGLTDEMLAWQTRELLAREIGRDGHVVFVKPELVAEIAFNDIQESPQYPGRLALRFARVKQYRRDKSAAEADTFETIRRLYTRMTGLEPPLR